MVSPPLVSVHSGSVFVFTLSPGVCDFSGQNQINKSAIDCLEGLVSEVT